MMMMMMWMVMMIKQKTRSRGRRSSLLHQHLVCLAYQHLGGIAASGTSRLEGHLIQCCDLIMVIDGGD